MADSLNNERGIITNIHDLLGNANSDHEDDQNSFNEAINKIGYGIDSNKDISKIDHFLKKNGITREDFTSFLNRIPESTLTMTRTIAEIAHTIKQFNCDNFDNEKFLKDAAMICSFDDRVGSNFLARLSAIDIMSTRNGKGYVTFISVLSPVSYGILMKPKNDIGNVVIDVMKEKSHRVHDGMIQLTDLAKVEPEINNYLDFKRKVLMELKSIECSVQSAYDHATN